MFTMVNTYYAITDLYIMLKLNIKLLFEQFGCQNNRDKIGLLSLGKLSLQMPVFCLIKK